MQKNVTILNISQSLFWQVFFLAEYEGYVTPEETVNFYANTASQDPEAHGTVDLAPCSLCGRKFARDRLAKHKKVCQSGQKKNRKVFDTSKMRTDGTEMAKYSKESTRRPEPKVKVWGLLIALKFVCFLFKYYKHSFYAYNFS